MGYDEILAQQAALDHFAALSRKSTAIGSRKSAGKKKPAHAQTAAAAVARTAATVTTSTASTTSSSANPASLSAPQQQQQQQQELELGPWSVATNDQGAATTTTALAATVTTSTTSTTSSSANPASSSAQQQQEWQQQQQQQQQQELPLQPGPWSVATNDQGAATMTTALAPAEDSDESGMDEDYGIKVQENEKDQAVGGDYHHHYQQQQQQQKQQQQSAKPDRERDSTAEKAWTAKTRKRKKLEQAAKNLGLVVVPIVETQSGGSFGLLVPFPAAPGVPHSISVSGGGGDGADKSSSSSSSSSSPSFSSSPSSSSPPAKKKKKPSFQSYSSPNYDPNPYYVHTPKITAADRAVRMACKMSTPRQLHIQSPKPLVTEKTPKQKEAGEKELWELVAEDMELPPDSFPNP